MCTRVRRPRRSSDRDTTPWVDDVHLAASPTRLPHESPKQRDPGAINRLRSRNVDRDMVEAQAGHTMESFSDRRRSALCEASHHLQ